jgi:anti-sigma B factor antagonist
METGTESLLVLIYKECAFIRVLKRGSFKISPALKKFGGSAIEKGCKKFVVDMESCLGMDSTFMGVLAGLALRLQREVAGEMVLINMTPKTGALIETLGLNRLLKMYLAGELTDDLKEYLTHFTGLSQLDTSNVGRKLTAETMLAAHEDLITVSPGNLPKFQDVLAYLKEDLESAGGSDDKNT